MRKGVLVLRMWCVVTPSVCRHPDMRVASLIKRIFFHPTMLDYTQIIPPGVGDRFSYRQDRLWLDK